MKFLINAHGSFDNVYAKLNHNVRIIMLNNNEPYFVSNDINSVVHTHTFNNNFNDEQFINDFNNKYTNLYKDSKGICIYQHLHHKINFESYNYYYPDLLLTPEHDTFESGIYKLPINLKKICMNIDGENDYGKIETIEKMSATDIAIFTSGKNRQLNNVMKNIVPYIIIPNNLLHNFFSLEYFHNFMNDISINNYKNNNLVRLSTIINFLSNLTDKQITITILACATKLTHTPSTINKHQLYFKDINKDKNILFYSHNTNVSLQQFKTFIENIDKKENQEQTKTSQNNNIDVKKNIDNIYNSHIIQIDNAIIGIRDDIRKQFRDMSEKYKTINIPKEEKQKNILNNKNNLIENIKKIIETYRTNFDIQKKKTIETFLLILNDDIKKYIDDSFEKINIYITTKKQKQLIHYIEHHFTNLYNEIKN